MYVNARPHPFFARTPHFHFLFQPGGWADEHEELDTLYEEGLLSLETAAYLVDNPTAQQATVEIIERGYTP